jgi:hypothetical protein
MTLTLELTPEQEERLRQEAEKEGLSVERFALLRLGLEQTAEQEESDTPLSERWKDYIGAIDSAAGAGRQKRPFEMRMIPELPEDVGQILKTQAEAVGVDVNEYIETVFNAFTQYFVRRPFMVDLARKRGWDIRRVFADHVRQNAPQIAVDWQIAKASEPDATPQMRAAAFRLWAASHRHGIPALSEEALSRESMYEDEGA